MFNTGRFCIEQSSDVHKLIKSILKVRFTLSLQLNYYLATSITGECEVLILVACVFV